MKEKQERGLYLTQKIRNVAYNTKYNLLKFFQQYNKESLVNMNSDIFILGQKFTTNQNNIVEVQQKIYEIFQRTPWLTYRCYFPQLPNEVVGSYISDTGWGCMVRVGQMLFAQVIKHHQNKQEKAQILKIIQLFSDFDKNQPFSIHKIARLARIQYGLKPGQWYNPSQIAYILSQLHQNSLAQQIKLKFIVFNSGNLFFDSLTEAMIEQKPKCQCKQKRQQFICPDCNQAKKSVSTIVLSRLGLNGPEKKYLKILQKLMEFSCCQGVIGGKPQKALYFIGKQNEYFIYLDPHYVQTAEKDVKQLQQTYFCQSFRKCKNINIDSSVGICFYFRDISQLNRFYKQINNLKAQNYEDFFIFIADKTPNYIKPVPMKSAQIFLKNSDTFQIL